MKRAVIITDLTQMRGQRVCIAGYFNDFKCVRPVDANQRIDKKWILDSQEAVIHPFAVVEFDFEDKKGIQKPHTEDWPISINYRSKLDVLDFQQREELLLKIDDTLVENIFKAPIHRIPGYYIQVGDGERSLGTVCHPEILNVFCGNRYGRTGYRITFRDSADKVYELTVTDLAFRYFIDHLKRSYKEDHQKASQYMLRKLKEANVHLRVGLARGWDSNPSSPQDKCFLQVTGVYSFPDYLDGSTFLKYM